jgi:hypothetical protein
MHQSDDAVETGRRLKLAVAIAIAGWFSGAEGVSAHCYSIWRYTEAQHCRTRAASPVAGPTPEPDIRSSDEAWSVEIVRLPEDLAYAVAVERLRTQLNGR